MLIENKEGEVVDATGSNTNKVTENQQPDIMETAESLVYRPLFVYRKIVHSKRRINFYNAFAGSGLLGSSSKGNRRKMWELKIQVTCLFLFWISFSHAGISPVHDLKEKMHSKLLGETFFFNSPHKVLKHLDNTILKSTKNITQNPQMEESLYQISKDLVSAVLSKLEIQDKITRITKEALEATGKNKGLTAIETRRILDYISRTLSGHMVSITKVSTEPELHRLVYGLAQIAAEVSIVSALKDITYASALSKKQSVDLSLRRKRSIETETRSMSTSPVPAVAETPSVYHAILNKTLTNVTEKMKTNTQIPQNPGFLSPYSVIPRDAKNSIRMINHKFAPKSVKGFLNQTALDIENKIPNLNETASIILDKEINRTEYVTVDSQTLATQELNAPGLEDDWLDTRDNVYKNALYSDLSNGMEIEPDAGDELTNDKKAKMKQERLEVKAKRAILYAGDVAYLTASSVVAMRRALTASIEVQMSVKYAKNGMSNHQDLMMNLAKTAAQQAGKEAKVATSKSLACERVIKLALKYTAQSFGANLNHVANRIVMDSLSLATLAKSMAFVASDIAINSLYQATDVKPPS
ncbi:hypothetical protein evm_002589 [Chilo suppressalis]|nr:hypothetical protein evm_002589 [Chilo suppressalis]